MSKKRLIGAACIIWLALALFSMLLFHTTNWLGVGCGHVVLAVTDKNQCRIGIDTYIVNDFNTMLEDLEQDGWIIVKPLEKDAQGHWLAKGGIYKIISLKKQAMTGYSIVIIRRGAPLIESLCTAFLVFLLPTILSILLFNSSNWVSVGYAHIVLAITAKNQYRIDRMHYLAKDFNTILEAFIERGWHIVEQDEQSYLMQKNNKYRNVVLKKLTITGYDLVMIGSAFSSISSSSIHE